MANNQAPRDGNFVPTALAWNGTSTVVLQADSVTKKLLIMTSFDAGAITTTTPVPHDGNHRPTLYALANDGSGTLIPLAADASGNLLVAEG